MNGLIRSRITQTLAALIMIAVAIVVPLSGAFLHSHAAASSSQNSFNIVPSPNPSTIGNVLQAVSVYDATHAWVVGSYANPSSNTYHDLIEFSSDGGATWTPKTGANPGANNNSLYGVKALSATNIWAVGDYVDANSNSHTLIEHSSDGGNTWMEDTTDEVANGELLAIDGDPSTGDAWAVGMYYDGVHVNGSPLTMQLVNGHFVSQPNVPPDSNPYVGITLRGISERTSSDIWAVGEKYTGGASSFALATYAMHFDGSNWTQIDSPSIAAQGDNHLFGVTTISSTDAWAVGESDYPNTIATLTHFHWNGSSWATTLLTLTNSPYNSVFSYLNGIAATSTDNIWAVGYEHGIGAFVWHSSDAGADWAQVPVQQPIGSGNFNSLSTDASGNILAVGGYSLSGVQETLIEQYTPSPTPVTQWRSPANGFYIQGTSVTLSVGVNSGASQITGITFTASWDSNSNVAICKGGLSSGNWVCKWGMKYNGSFVRNGPINFGYIVATTAGNIVNPNGMLSGTIVYELMYKNASYAGYSATSHNNTVAYSEVIAKWTVPKVVTCGLFEQSESAVWDGLAGNNQLVQIGTESNCNFLITSYSAVWQVVPTITAQTINYTVSPGDKMTATVAFDSTNSTFNLTLVDSGKWMSNIPLANLITNPSVPFRAECIVEDPLNAYANSDYPLTNFGKVSLDCKVDSLAIANGPENIKFLMVNSNNVTKAVTKPLAIDGETFTVVWKQAS